MSQPLPLDIPPGIVKVDAPHVLNGRYISCDKVRFVKGKPEKWKGWEQFSDDIVGVVSAILCWDDNGDSRWIAVGTQLGLYLLNSAGEGSKITPYRITGTLPNNPFAMTSGSPDVTVTHTAHGLLLGAYVNYSGATAAGGITISGEYQVVDIPTLDSYVITHTSNASSTTTGGGASVAYKYDLNPAGVQVVQGLGWGTGTWGTGTWGTPRASSNFTAYPRIWSLDTYGENLLALASGDYLFQWNPNTPSDRAARVANCPTGNAMFMTNERYPIILGADGDNKALAWPDQNDITNWTPSSTSTAAVRRVQKGSRLVAGANLINTANIVWTDSAVYSMNYTGQRTAVYSTVLAGERCGLIGPHAFFIMGGRAFWMSSFDFFMYGGTVERIPNADDIRDWLYEQLDGKQNWRAVGHYSSPANEGRWNIFLNGEEFPSMYVAVSLDDFSWTYGYLSRTAWTEKNGINAVTYAADPTGVIYRHEVGEDAAGVPMDWSIETSPIEIDDGNIIDVHGYIPNFKVQAGDIELTLTFYDLLEDTTPLETITETITPGRAIIDIHGAGRQVAFRLSQSQLGGRFRLGIPKVEVASGGQRRGGR